MDDSDSPQIPSLSHESFWYLKCISGLRDMKRAATVLARVQRRSHSGKGFFRVQSGQGSGWACRILGKF